MIVLKEGIIRIIEVTSKVSSGIISFTFLSNKTKKYVTNKMPDMPINSRKILGTLRMKEVYKLKFSILYNSDV